VATTLGSLDGAPPRVLVIDDDPTMCEVVTRYLEREGFVVAQATDGDAGLRDALAMLPDLVCST
jgi:DNA-binding response OmpR family regulator